MSNAFVGQNGYYFIYNGCPIGYAWSASWNDRIPNIIIKRNSGSAQRPAIAVRDPNHMLPTETPESVSAEFYSGVADKGRFTAMSRDKSKLISGKIDSQKLEAEIKEEASDESSFFSGKR